LIGKEPYNCRVVSSIKLIPRYCDMLHDKLIEEASKWIGVQEKGTNKGPEVEAFQKYVDGVAVKEPWCAAFVMFCVGHVETREKIRTRLFKTEHVLTMWNKTPKELRCAQPKEGCIVLWVKTGTTSGHCGIITKVHSDSIETIEGNTSPSSKVEREGDGVYKKTRALAQVGSLKIVGFLDPFVNLKGVN
jgi:hypothetical protein